MMGWSHQPRKNSLATSAADASASEPVNPVEMSHGKMADARAWALRTLCATMYGAVSPLGQGRSDAWKGAHPGA
eukprot:scaffold18902_cov119-Isochrysis_galbana.AAC.2